MSIKFLPTRILGGHRAGASQDAPAGDVAALPFITIAPQIGTEPDPLADRLMEMLNGRDSENAAWSHWDQELVDKVSADNDIPAELIASLDTWGHSWIDELLDSGVGHMEETVIFNCIRKSVRELAAGGHVILVGHGSSYMTRDMPGGVHVRLVAPVDVRIKNFARRMDISPRQAARHVHHVDKNRQRFLIRFWPERSLGPEIYTVVFNVAELNDERIADAIMSLFPAEHADRG